MMRLPNLAQSFLTMIIGDPVNRGPSAPSIGSGVRLAAERLQAKRAANRLIPDNVIVTRQQRRAEDRKWQKQIRKTPAERARRNMAR